MTGTWSAHVRLYHYTTGNTKHLYKKEFEGNTTSLFLIPAIQFQPNKNLSLSLFNYFLNPSHSFTLSLTVLFFLFFFFALLSERPHDDVVWSCEHGSAKGPESSDSELRSWPPSQAVFQFACSDGNKKKTTQPPALHFRRFFACYQSCLHGSIFSFFLFCSCFSNLFGCRESLGNGS